MILSIKLIDGPPVCAELITPWEKNTCWLWFHNSHFCLYNWFQPFDLVGQMTTAISIEDVRGEVKILKALSGHSNIVKFYDACEDALNVYIIMEYVFPLASAYHWSNKCKILWIFARAILKLYVWLCSKVISQFGWLVHCSSWFCERPCAVATGYCSDYFL